MTGPRLAMRQRLRTDWFRVLTDLQYAQPIPFPNARVADLIGVPSSTLRTWKNGCEPSHSDGYALLELWCEVTRKTVSERPMLWR